MVCHSAARTENNAIIAPPHTPKPTYIVSSYYIIDIQYKREAKKTPPKWAFSWNLSLNYSAHVLMYETTEQVN